MYHRAWDFNLPELDWSGDQTAPMNNGSRADHNIFCDLKGENFLQQFIPGPTHLAGNKLGLLLCNWPEVIGSVRSFHPRVGLFPSDHYVVEFEIILKFKRAKRVTFNFETSSSDIRPRTQRSCFFLQMSEWFY